jgi:hypothetical protein
MRRRTGPVLRIRRAGAATDLFVLRLDFAGISAIASPLPDCRDGFYHAHATPITTDVSFFRAL